MNGRAHKLAGCVMGAGIAHFAAGETDDWTRTIETIGGALGGYFGGRLPDLLEPATSPNHRQLMHSVTVGVGGSRAAFEWIPEWQAALRARAEQLWETPDAWQAVGLLLLSGALPGLAAGYVSHLVLDVTTPAGLPLL